MDVLDALRQALADRYTIERELGAGGMATVYLAEDLKHHRKVALKVLRPELAATLGPDRFAREIEVAARLQHPHILPLHDSGEAGGFFYYVMPYVEGETLRDRLARSGELPVPEALRLLGEVAEALAVAHRGGVVHRDIKPENILLSGRHALVMDFGVAKAVTEATGRQQLTSAGVAMGTPAYMAPEQASADPHLDHRVDIYALGVMAYEMLTGQTPFHGLSPQQTLTAHVTQAPMPVAARRPGLAAALDGLVMKCLAKRPADRYQTAEDLLAALEPLATPSGGTTPTGTAPTRATLGPRRWIAVAAVAVVVVLLGWWGVRQLGRRAAPAASPGESAAPSIAVLPFENVGGDSTTEAYADGISDDIRTALGKIGLRVTPRSSSYYFKGRRVEPAEIGSRLRVGSYLTGTLRRAGGDLRVAAELVDVAGGAVSWTESFAGRAGDIFRFQDSIAAAVAGALSVRLGARERAAMGGWGTTSLEAHDLYQQGAFFEARYTEPDLRRAIALYERAAAADPRYAAPLAGMSRAWSELADDWLPPREAEPRAKAAALRALAVDSSSAEAHEALARVLMWYEWDAAGAEREFRRAMALDPHSSPGAYLSLLLSSRGQADSAIALARLAVAADPLARQPMFELADRLVLANRLDSAEVVLGRLREIDPQYPARLPQLVGWIRIRQGRFADCLREIRQADSTLGVNLAVAGTCEARLGQRADALRRVAAAEAARRVRYVDGTFIARVYVALGDYDAAFRWLDRAFADRSAHMATLFVFPWDPIRSDPRFRALEQRVAAAAGRP